MRAALEPETPAPRMVIFAAGTPGTPPSRMPMPPRLYFADQLGVLPRVADTRAGLLVGGVRGADAHAGGCLHYHLVAVRDELAHRGRRETDAVLVRLDFLGDADDHCGRRLCAVQNRSTRKAVGSTK